MSADMTTLEILVGARELIADPAHWTQGEAARDRYGILADVFGKDAVCFCSWGAIRHVAGKGNYDFNDAVSRLNDALPAEDGLLSVVGWQDESVRTHDQVLAVFDRAIEKQRAAE